MLNCNIYITYMETIMLAKEIIWKLLDYYGVETNVDLANKMNVNAQTITNWNYNNRIEAISKKCRELGIYNKIFGDTNIQKIKSITGGQNAQNVYGGMNQDTPTSQSIDESSEIDTATFELFKEMYKNAIEKDELKKLRIYLMSY